MINRWRALVSQRIREELTGSRVVSPRALAGDVLTAAGLMRRPWRICTTAIVYSWAESLSQTVGNPGRAAVARRMPVHRLADDFLGSREFRARRRALNEPVQIELAGFKLYVRQGDWSVGVHIARDLAYEPHVTREIRAVLSEGDVFIDIGANIGYFTLLAAAVVGDSGKVIAFEPNPPNCELIQLSMRANDFHNILVQQAAVLDEAQAVALEVEGSNAGIADGIQEGDLVVEAVVLDDVLQGESKIDVIKMDIEGSEAQRTARDDISDSEAPSSDIYRVLSSASGEQIPCYPRGLSW